MKSPSTRARSAAAAPGRRGFTLVELMVVIVIIGILVALLLPAITGAVRTARTGAASAEINQLAQALAQFKSQYGVYPPSRIVLSENGDYTLATLGVDPDPTYGALKASLQQRSVSYLRRIWPKMSLVTVPNSPLPSIPGGFYDFNNNQVLDSTPYMIDGAECLVFFLGGLPGKVDGAMTTVGFSKNPSNPAISPNAALGGNRSTPMFEFRPGRLNDNYGYAPVTGSDGNPVNANGFPEYSDNLSNSGTLQPFVYFSAYDGTGYDPDDANYAEEGILVDSNGNTVSQVPANWTTYGQPSSGIAGMFQKGTATYPSFAPNPYTNGPPIQMQGTINPEYVNKNTFQIVSAGIDGLFGIGGWYKATPAAGGEVLPLPIPVNPTMPDVGFPGTPWSTWISRNARLVERDNVTNFKGGRLD